MKKDIATRDKILKAARSIFVEKGRDGARMQEIADRAGVNKALLFYYYTSKENLYREIITTAFNELIANFGELFEMDLPLEEQIKRFIQRHLDFLAQNNDLPKLIVQEVVREDNILCDFLANLFSSNKFDLRKKLVLSFEKAIREGKMEPHDPIQTIINIISLNTFYFIAKPLIDTAFPEATQNQAEFLEKRKKAITEMVLRSLFKPKG